MDDISTSFRPISMLQETSVSSRIQFGIGLDWKKIEHEEPNCVQVTEVSRVFLVEFTKNVNPSSKPLENKPVFSPKLTACDGNTTNNRIAIK